MPPLSGGQKLAGCYVLRHQVSRGAGVPVWLAHDEVLGKDVSLHFVPSPVRSDERAMSDLRHEVKRNRQLIHPNILRVYDLVEESDWAAVAMDSFEGSSLAMLAREKHGGRFEAVEVLPWLGQLGQTLDDAHKIQLVHGDLSPSNIFIDRAGKVVLANFGISRCVQDASARVSGSVNPRLGSHSPQQLDGHTPTASDDIYGLGALLFELLTGVLPIAGDDLIGKVRTQVPVRAKGQAVAAQIPPAWDEVVAECLQKNPAQRPSSAGQIAARLSRPAAAVASAGGAALSAPAPTLVEPPARKPIDVLLAKAAEAARNQAAGPAAPLAASMQPPKNELSPNRDAERNSVPDVFPSLYPRRAGIPVAGLAAAVVLIVVGLSGYYFSGTKPQVETQETADISTERPDGSDITSVNNRIEAPQVPAVEATNAPAVETEGSRAKPAVSDRELFAAAASPVPDKTSVAVAAPVVVTPSAPEPTAASRAATDKAAVSEKMKREAEAAETAHQEMLKQQQAADAAVAETQKAIEQKNKELGPLKKAAEDLVKQRKLKEDAQKAAELEAQKAQQMALEKVRLAEEAKKAFVDLEIQNKEKLTAQERADSEIQAMQKALADKQRSASDAAKAASAADVKRQQQLASAKQAEQEAAQARMVVEQMLAAEAALKAREEAERVMAEKTKEREKISKEIAEMKQLFDAKMKVLEQTQRDMEAAEIKSKDTAAAVKKAEDDIKKGGTKSPVPEKPVVPVVSVKSPTSDNAPAPEKLPPLDRTPPVEKLASPEKVAAADLTLAMKTDPSKPSLQQPQQLPSTGAFVNSLGMKFAPVGDTQFSVWQTRVKDFEVFAKSVNLKSTTWKGPGFKQGADHPVVNVTWQEAIAFCKWLTEKERREGLLQPTHYYRLPADLEWSNAVGLSDETGDSPEARDMGVSDVYPWGTQWPPPPGSGNYTGEETGSDVAIKGYDDGFAWTSPVGSFPPNSLGLYDMGGNVWQWCMDQWNKETKDKVLRGASWYNGALKLSLLSSCRVHAAPDNSTDNYGFRIVLIRGTEPSKAAKK